MKWEKSRHSNDYIKYVECSSCGHIQDYESNFCPSCGEKNNGTVDRTVFAVTYWDNGVEPVVTVFDNRENAEKCCSFFKGKHDGCCVDEVPIYSNFGINNKELIYNEIF